MQVSLGKITCTVPGQPIRASINVAAAEEDYMVHAYSVQWSKNNQGAAYVSLSPEDDRVTQNQILAVLDSSTPGFSAGITIELSGINMRRVFFDFDNADDSVICSALTY